MPRHPNPLSTEERKRRTAARCKRYEELHRDRLREKKREYRAKNYIDIYVTHHEWYMKNRERILEKNKKKRAEMKVKKTS